ncbi:TonB-dependent receptor plug domain-containing protein [Muricauda sp. SCSIO 64092]|uniref:TonB-dependent receptor plug domain-containing protein n=1 Tax=Allomuricauda sp. SCSIO 64092 TaxID=2908842 RepID=UPI001FF1A919|nr:TonB-dependent receptor plug domain-containing protein [Muricauda sp. SCSIO 64092]UOY05102.1 TonB-dependent receptor plug domain-containing protein [Muricauda sp. SCSIO 64092]
MRKIGYAIVLFLSCLPSLRPQSPIIKTRIDNLNKYRTHHFPEKVFLHTDKEVYRAGETIWFKTYLLNGVTHFNSTKSNLVYVELLDQYDSIVAKRVNIMQGFGSAGHIDLDSILPKGPYYIRAFTRYMVNDDKTNFYQKRISLLGPHATVDGHMDLINGNGSGLNPLSSSKDETENIELEFYPEGGQLAARVLNNLVIKAKNTELIDLSTIEGSIIDYKGIFVTGFKLDGYGLCKIDLKPKPDTNYFAKLIGDENKLFPLPGVHRKGFALRVQHNARHLIIDVGSDSIQFDGVTVIGHLRGKLFLNFRNRGNQENGFAIRLKTDKIGSGLAHILLLDKEGNRIAKRLVFIQPPEKGPSIVRSDKEQYKKGDTIKLFLSLPKSESDITGNFSLSIAPESLHRKSSADSDMFSHMHFQSDYPNDPNPLIPKPFEVNGLANRILDKYLITQSWDSYIWSSLDDTSTLLNKGEGEKGVKISGKIKEYDGQNEVFVRLIMMGESGSFHSSRQKTEKGRFNFGPFLFEEKMQVSLSAQGMPGKKRANRGFSFLLDSIWPNNVASTRTKKLEYVNAENWDIGNFTFYGDSTNAAPFSYGDRIIRLEEIVVTEKLKRKTEREVLNQKLDKLTIYGRGSSRIIMEDHRNYDHLPIEHILRLLPGVQVLLRGGSSFKDFVIRIRGTNTLLGSMEPLFLIDGVRVTQDIIALMNPQEILFIDLLTGGKAAAYGTRGANGVIAIYTRKGDLEADSSVPKRGQKSGISFEIGGFEPYRQFDYTDYGQSMATTTAYWNPFLTLEGRKVAVLELNSAYFSGTGDYNIIINGVTNDGNIWSSKQSIAIH